jgi:hypothetical protein
MTRALAQQVFISHAGADSAKAAAVAGVLNAADIDVRLDRQELRLGDSFLQFIESALAQSDYCLLLWSRNAAATPWVQLEWESALYRSVQEKRAFLVCGRLEETALPALLAPRLRVDLFPDLQPGIGDVIAAWRSDRRAEAITHRPVAASPMAQPDDVEGDTLYVTSEAFGITVPLSVDLGAPAGVLLDRIVNRAGLPKLWQHEGRIGVHFTYTLMKETQALDRARSLSSQDVTDKSVVWLKTQMSPFSATAPMDGALGAATFRSGVASESPSLDPMLTARQTYLSAIRRAALDVRTTTQIAAKDIPRQ